MMTLAWPWGVFPLAGLLCFGACSFPDYGFAEPGASGGSSGATIGSGGTAAGGTTAIAGSPAMDPCADGERNGDETDVDCGGSCAPCANGSTCVSAFDCASQYCPETSCEPSLAVDCRCINCEAATVSTQQMVFSLRNLTESTVPLNRFKLRYYFRQDSGEVGRCTSAPFPAGCESTESAHGAVTPARPDVDTYWEMTFLPSAGDILGMSSTGETTVEWAAPESAAFDQSSDYSWVPHWESEVCSTWTLWNVAAPEHPAWGTPP